MRLLKRKTIIVVLLICGVFIFSHITPSFAVKTHIFMKGYPIEAIGNALPDYKVTKFGILYFANDYDIP